MTTNDLENLPHRLGQAGPEDLAQLVREHLESLDPPALRQIFRNPHLTTQVIEALARQKHLLTYHEVRKELARHPATPEVLALRFVSSLFWRDLLELVSDHRVRPRIRRAAERTLLDRMAGLGTGEKVSIARRAGPLLVSQLRHDPDPRVIGALMENPRLTEGGLVPMVSSDTTAPDVLELVARNPKWGVRYPIRVSLARNRRTPPQIAIGILPYLRKHDLKGIEQDRRLNMAVRRRAAVLLGRPPV